MFIATKDSQTIHVRVRTKTSDSKLFRWNLRKDGRVFREAIGADDFCVLVDIGGKSPVYYVIPTVEVESQLQNIRRDWLAGKATRPANRVIAFEYDRDDQWLASFTNWDVLLERRFA
jgi:hypothetical protein